MNIESLKAAGLSDDQAQAVMKQHKEAIDGNYVTKAAFDAERTKNATLSTQVAERDAQIGALGDFKGTAEQLSAKVAELETANTEAKKAWEKELKSVQEDATLKIKLSDLVYDAGDVIGKLDKTKLKWDKDDIKGGLDEQLEELKKTSPHYFKPATPADTGLPAGWKPAGQPPVDSVTQASNTPGIGQVLAARRKAESDVAQKAQDTYFTRSTI